MTDAARPYDAAVRLLEHHETAADAFHWPRDDNRDAYLMRTLLQAQVFALLSVSQQLTHLVHAVREAAA